MRRALRLIERLGASSKYFAFSVRPSLLIAIRDESKGQAASTNLSSGRHLEDGVIEL